MPKSVRRTFDILRILEKSGERLSIASISSAAELPPSTVHRLLAVMKDYQFVLQDEYTQEYYLGPALVSLGLKASNYIDMRRSAVKFLTQAMQDTLEDAYLAIKDSDFAVVIEKVTGPQPLKVMDSMRATVPLHCGAIRKILLANSDDDYIDEYVKRDFEPITENTIVNKDDLLKEIETIRSLGYAVSHSEYIMGGSGVAVPIRDSYGKVVAAMGVIGTEERFTDERVETMAESLLRIGKAFSEELGYFEADSEE